MTVNKLYRPEAVEAKRSDNLGKVILLRPIAFSVFAAFGLFVTVALLLFLFFGTYSSRITTAGQLIPSTGLIKVFAQQRGTIIKKLAKEGQEVEQGEVLYVLSADRATETGAEAQSSVIEQLGRQRASLEQELRKAQQLHVIEQETIQKKISTLRSEHENLLRQIEGQRARVSLAESAMLRSQGLLAKGYISQDQIQAKQSDAIDQKNRLQSLERDTIAIERELANQMDEAVSAPLRSQTQLSQLSRQLSTITQDVTERQSARRIVVTAPSKGVVTSIASEVGQTVDVDKPLLSVLPVAAPLEAHLYAPSRAMGFVKVGSVVKIRYQAYPYQKFGHATGRVTVISRVPVKIADVDAGSGAGSSAGSEEMRYQIHVKLDSQYVMAYGQPRALQAGMLLEADIIQETRRLYEWVLEPLRTVTGKI